MDNKRSIIGMIVVVVLSVFWLQVVYPWLAKRNNWTLAPTAATQPAPATTTPQAASPATTGAVASTGPSDGLHAVGGPASTQPAVIGSVQFEKDAKHPKSPYPVGLSITPRGAGLASVTLNRFRNQYDQESPYVFQKPYDVTSPLSVALATRSISIDGGPAISLENIDWKLVDGATETTASFQADVAQGDKPLVRVTKTFELRNDKDQTLGYEAVVRYAIQNLSGDAHKVKLAYNGPNAPNSENNRDIPEVVAGFEAPRQDIDVAHAAVSGIKQDKPLEVKEMKAGQALLWSGVTSAYFDALLRPTDASGGRLALAAAQASLLNPGEEDPFKRAVAIGYETTDVAVPANGTTAFTVNAFFGPKLRSVLNNDYYSSFPRNYDATLVLTGGFCGVCTFTWLVNGLVKLLQGFHFIFQDWGVAIIALVCLVRVILHPVTKRSQVSMSKMSKMGPATQKLKEKYGADSEAFKKAQVELMKEQGIGPYLGCLPMFLQIPIWIALWSALQSTFEMRHAPFLYGLSWIHDLSQPDHLIYFPNHAIAFSLFGGHIRIDALNILPILFAVVLLISTKIQQEQQAAAGTLSPEMQSQQKLMLWMSPVMSLVFLYTGPAGLLLYTFTSTLIGIVESKRVRDHIREQAEKEKQGIVIIDEPPPAKDERRGGAGLSPGQVRRKASANEPPKPTTGIAGFMQRIREKVEEAQREQERRAKRGGR